MLQRRRRYNGRHNAFVGGRSIGCGDSAMGVPGPRASDCWTQIISVVLHQNRHSASNDYRYREPNRKPAFMNATTYGGGAGALPTAPPRADRLAVRVTSSSSSSSGTKPLPPHVGHCRSSSVPFSMTPSPLQSGQVLVFTCASLWASSRAQTQRNAPGEHRQLSDVSTWALRDRRCPLLGAKQTSCSPAGRSLIDLQRTCAVEGCCSATLRPTPFR